MKTLLLDSLSDINAISMTQGELERMRIPNDYVLIKLHRGNDEIIINKGTENESKIFIPINEGNQEQHAPIYCTVVKVCERLTNVGAGLWETDIEVQEGDEVIVYYLPVITALGGYFLHGTGNNKSFVVEGDTYVYVPYRDIYCAVRGEEIIPVNGYCLAAPVEAKKTSELEIEAKQSEWQAVVKYLGKPNKRYLDKDKFGKEVFYDSDEISVGDIVLMGYSAGLIFLEMPLHQILNERLMFFQRRDVIATLSEVISK